MKKILFLYNNYEREHVNIERISKELQKKKGIKVYQISCMDKDLPKRLLQLRPHIIVTYPITTYIQIYMYMLAKICCRSLIVTFTTEGLIDYYDKEVLKLWAGAYDYSPTLVDYHIFWGRALAKHLGRELHIQNKVLAKSQIKIAGNPMYEKEWGCSSPEARQLMRDRRSKVLALTAFSRILYTKQDLINAQDIVNVQGRRKDEIVRDETFVQYMEAIEKERAYCEKYIAHIVNAARRHKEILFIVKLHPHEIESIKAGRRKMKYLEPLRQFENIKLIEKSIPISELLPLSRLMIHYGSTVDLESYLYKTPTLKLEQRDIVNRYMTESKRLTASTYYEDIDEVGVLEKYMERIEAGDNLFQRNREVEKQLYEYMNYVPGKSYRPSKEVADFLSGRLKFHKLKIGFGQRLHYITEALRIHFGAAPKI